MHSSYFFFLEIAKLATKSILMDIQAKSKLSCRSGIPVAHSRAWWGRGWREQLIHLSNPQISVSVQYSDGKLPALNVLSWSPAKQKLVVLGSTSCLSFKEVTGVGMVSPNQHSKENQSTGEHSGTEQLSWQYFMFSSAWLQMFSQGCLQQ